MAKTIRAKNKCADTMEQRAKGIDGAPNPRPFLRGKRQATGPRLSDSVSDSTENLNRVFPRAALHTAEHNAVNNQLPRILRASDACRPY